MVVQPVIDGAVREMKKVDSVEIKINIDNSSMKIEYCCLAGK